MYFPKGLEDSVYNAKSFFVTRKLENLRKVKKMSLTCEKTRNAIRTTSSILGIPLLHSSNMSSNIFEADGIFNSETVGLAFLNQIYIVH